MIRRIPEPSRSQWAIVAALVETGALRRRGSRFFAAERAPRSFPFVAVTALIPRGYARATDGSLSTIEPTQTGIALLSERRLKEGAAS